tara:strand:- start:473 stop:643 length:171 start_codon:yes stop_codon:yes gene_type:complete
MWGEKKRGNSRQSQKYKNFDVLEKKRRKSKKDSKDENVFFQKRSALSHRSGCVLSG